MSICLKRLADVSARDVSALEKSMTQFYTRPNRSYYELADRASLRYTRELQPFHCDLVERTEPGMRMLEIGCGTAHLCTEVEKRGVIYTGIDHAANLLAENRKKFPRARFVSIEDNLDETFDVVASLYTIEHVANPPMYLERMLHFCRPGGLIAIICPEFIANDSLPPSLYYGKTPRRLREKILSLDLADAFSHVVDLKWRAKQWQKTARQSPPGAFWLNLEPRVLYGANYSTDADAIHFSRLADLIDWFEKRSLRIVVTSQSLSGIDPTILRYNCYVVARKPMTEEMPK